MGSVPAPAESASLRLEVQDLMSAHVVCIDAAEDLDLAVQIMRLIRIRHLPVLQDGRLAGILSHRDLLRVQASSLANLTHAEQRNIRRAITVRRVMRAPVVTAQPTTSAIEAARVMCVRKLGCLPVVEGDRLLGIITKSDFVATFVRTAHVSMWQRRRQQRVGPETTRHGEAAP